MKTKLWLFALCSLLPACTSPPDPDYQRFYAQEIRLADRSHALPRAFFGPNDVPAVIVAGAGYYGHDLRVDFYRISSAGTTAFLSAGRTGRLRTPESFLTWWHPNMASGRYSAWLYVDGAAAGRIEFTVQR